MKAAILVIPMPGEDPVIEGTSTSRTDMRRHHTQMGSDNNRARSRRSQLISSHWALPGSLGDSWVRFS